jgi:hypothetical protein
MTNIKKTRTRTKKIEVPNVVIIPARPFGPNISMVGNFKQSHTKFEITAIDTNYKLGIFNLDRGVAREFDIEIKDKYWNREFDKLVNKGSIKIEYR